VVILVNPLKLGGDHSVQIDESLFGGKMKYFRGDHFKHVQSWVFGLIEETTGRCVFWLVDDRKKGTLLPIIREHIIPGSTIKSDQYSPYLTLGEEGFSHFMVNHSREFVTSSGIHTQLIESTWSQIKSIIKVKRGTVAEHLPGILDYYSFICLAEHNKKSRLDSFFELIQANNYY
jgi:transposase